MFLLDGRFDIEKLIIAPCAKIGFNPCFYWMGVLTRRFAGAILAGHMFQSLFLLDGRFDPRKKINQLQRVKFQSLFLLDGRFDISGGGGILPAERSFNPCFYWMGVLTKDYAGVFSAPTRGFNPCFYWMGVLTSK